MEPLCLRARHTSAVGTKKTNDEQASAAEMALSFFANVSTMLELKLSSRTLAYGGPSLSLYSWYGQSRWWRSFLPFTFRFCYTRCVSRSSAVYVILKTGLNFFVYCTKAWKLVVGLCAEDTAMQAWYLFAEGICAHPNHVLRRNDSECAVTVIWMRLTVTDLTHVHGYSDRISNI